MGYLLRRASSRRYEIILHKEHFSATDPKNSEVFLAFATAEGGNTRLLQSQSHPSRVDRPVPKTSPQAYERFSISVNALTGFSSVPLLRVLYVMAYVVSSNYRVTWSHLVISV